MVAMTVHDTFCVKCRLVYDPWRQATVMTARWSCLNGFFVSNAPIRPCRTVPVRPNSPVVLHSLWSTAGVTHTAT
jgi:hypothetical protein